MPSVRSVRDACAYNRDWLPGIIVVKISKSHAGRGAGIPTCLSHERIITKVRRCRQETVTTNLAFSHCAHLKISDVVFVMNNYEVSNRKEIFNTATVILIGKYDLSIASTVT